MTNAKLEEPPILVPQISQYYPKEKPRRVPKYNKLRKVMPREEIPSFIRRVAYDLTHRKPHVPENDTPWDDSGVVEYMCTSLSRNEP